MLRLNDLWENTAFPVSMELARAVPVPAKHSKKWPGSPGQSVKKSRRVRSCLCAVVDKAVSGNVRVITASRMVSCICRTTVTGLATCVQNAAVGRLFACEGFTQNWSIQCWTHTQPLEEVVRYVMFMLCLIAAMVDRVVPGHFPVIGYQLFRYEGLSKLHVPRWPFPKNLLYCVQLSRTVRTLFFAPHPNFFWFGFASLLTCCLLLAVAAAQDYDTCKLRLSDEPGLKECEAVSYMELFSLPAGGGDVTGLFLLIVQPVESYLDVFFYIS